MARNFEFVSLKLRAGPGKDDDFVNRFPSLIVQGEDMGKTTCGDALAEIAGQLDLPDGYNLCLWTSGLIVEELGLQKTLMEVPGQIAEDMDDQLGKWLYYCIYNGEERIRDDDELLTCLKKTEEATAEPIAEQQDVAMLAQQPGENVPQVEDVAMLAQQPDENVPQVEDVAMLAQQPEENVPPATLRIPSGFPGTPSGWCELV